MQTGHKSKARKFFNLVTAKMIRKFLQYFYHPDSHDNNGVTKHKTIVQTCFVDCKIQYFSLTVFFLLYLFILRLRESALYCCLLDGLFALAWEFPFQRCLGHPCLPHKGKGVPLSALFKDTAIELAGLFSTTFLKCRAPSREAVNTIFKM